MPVWKMVKNKMSIEIKAVEKFIPAYDYSSESRAEATDGKICKFMIEEVRKSKDYLFHIIQVAYELHEESLDKNFQGLRDDLDIFSDEIKVRNFQWSRDLSQAWIEKLIKHDYHLVQQMHKLNKELDDLHKIFLKVVKLYPKKTDPKQLEQVRKLIKLLEKAVDKIVLTFKEREVICNLKPLALEKTYQQMKDYYERLI
ncbi:MAG: hypothetical protein KAU24_04450 [Candidatus Aenigmarchaeota archaeon]|nr:hypothetical protein [Candidatus Aenigmarchaeota archaeon]